MAYELYYWPGLQGRGEFVRLAFEEAGVPYRDVGREPKGVDAILRGLRGGLGGTRPFGPPFLKHGKLVVAHTAHILEYLGPRLGLVPAGEPARLAAHQHQLTITDLVAEVHDTHHPLGPSEYYENMKPEAVRRTADFLKTRMPRFLGYFDALLAGRYVLGARISYVDLSLFQVVEGLGYAFPRAFARYRKKIPRLIDLHDRVAARPRIKAYVASDRRVPFNEEGIFRHYPELDR